MMKHIIPITKPLVHKSKDKSINIDIKSFISQFEYEKLYSAGNRHFIIVKDSGIFFELDQAAYDLLKADKVVDWDSKISHEIINELQELIWVGAFEKLNSEDVDSSTYLNSLNINISGKCNLSCRYCFAKEGTYGIENNDITMEILKNAIDTAVARIPHHCKMNIVLFGGEPLMRRDLVDFAITYSREKQHEKDIEIIIDIFTNGTLIDQEFVDFIEKDEGIRLLISIDGPPQINDYNRKLKNGAKLSQVFEDKVELIQSISENRIVIRATLTEKKPDIVGKVEYFRKLGFKNIVFDVSYCKDHDTIPASNQLLSGLQNEIHELANYIIIQVKRRHNLNVNLLSENIAQVLMNRKDAESPYVGQCPAGRNYLAVDTSGNIYPCHFFVGEPNYKLGNICKDGLTQKNMSTDNGVTNLSKKAYGNCKHCSLVNVCEGPCPYKQLIINSGSTFVSEEFCSLLKTRFSESLRVLSTIYKSDKWPFLDAWNDLVKTRGGI
jgi:uncharacterized protein